MSDDPAPPVLIAVDFALEAAARWRGVSPAAYVEAVIAEAVEADTALIRYARESLDSAATVDQKALDAWFDANDDRRSEG